MHGPDGRPTNAIFGFLKALERLRERTAAGLQSKVEVLNSKVRAAGVAGGAGGSSAVKAETSDLAVLVVWDGGLDAGRLAALPGYKAQRPEMPAELGAQIDGIVEYLDAAGVASVCRDGMEADDVIASVARRAARAGSGVLVASSDKDFMQLVVDAGGEGREGGAGWIGLLNPNDKSERIWGAAEVRAKAGVAPEQVVDWLALMGDTVDNIPGVPGVGAKTAAGLLGVFGSVNGLYARLGDVKSERLRGALAAAEADVRRNVGLVRLRDDLDSELDVAALAVKPAQRERLAELFRQWGFRSLLVAVTARRQEDLL